MQELARPCVPRRPQPTRRSYHRFCHGSPASCPRAFSSHSSAFAAAPEVPLVPFAHRASRAWKARNHSFREPALRSLGRSYTTRAAARPVAALGAAVPVAAVAPRAGEEKLAAPHARADDEANGVHVLALAVAEEWTSTWPTCDPPRVGLRPGERPEVSEVVLRAFAFWAAGWEIVGEDGGGRPFLAGRGGDLRPRDW